jgi:hypothetical protein
MWQPLLPFLAAFGMAWFMGHMLIARVLYRGSIATLGKKTFFLYSAVYAGVEVLGFLIFLLGIRVVEQANPASSIYEIGFLPLVLVAVVSITILTFLRKLPYIRDVLEGLKAPKIAISPK